MFNTTAAAAVRVKLILYLPPFYPTQRNCTYCRRMVRNDRGVDNLLCAGPFLNYGN